MSSRYVEVDMSEFKKFFGSVKRAAKGEFRKEFERFLEGLGYEFLRILQDEIVRRKVMDSKLLLASFEKGSNGNVWNMLELEQEIASIMKFLIDQTKVVPYYWKIPSNFVVPSIYFPMSEIDTDGETFLTYAMEYSWYIKIFHEKEEDAYSLGLMVVTKIRAARNLIPLILEDGSKIKGSWIRVNDPKLKILDDGSAQLTLNWRSRRPYNDTLEEVQYSQSRYLFPLTAD